MDDLKPPPTQLKVFSLGCITPSEPNKHWAEWSVGDDCGAESCLKVVSQNSGSNNGYPIPLLSSPSLVVEMFAVKDQFEKLLCLYCMLCYVVYSVDQT